MSRRDREQVAVTRGHERRLGQLEPGALWLEARRPLRPRRAVDVSELGAGLSD